MVPAPVLKTRKYASILRRPQINWIGLVSRSFERVPHQLLLTARHLRRAKLVGQLVDLAGEAERQLVAVVHRGAGVTADVKGFVDRHQERNRGRHRLLGDLLAIDREHTGAALAGAGSIVLEVKHNRVLAGLERVAEDIATSHAALPAIPLEIEHVVGKYRLALEQIEAVSAEATAVSGDHSFGAAL